jgi:hypothetical protein
MEAMLFSSMMCTQITWVALSRTSYNNKKLNLWFEKYTRAYMTHIDNQGKWYDIHFNKICDWSSQFDESLPCAIYGGMSITLIQLGIHKSSNSFQCDFEFPNTWKHKQQWS